MKKTNNQKAFTLFELLVSISIIAILTAIASMSFSATQKKARDARRIQDMNSIQKAAEQYYSQNSYAYPANTGAFTTSGVLQSWPLDPKGATWLPQYSYSSPTTTAYCACAFLENATGGNSGAACAFVANGNYYCVKNQQ